MSTISAGTTSGTALVSTGDTTGALVIQTNGTTTAVTIDTSQRVGFGTASPTARVQVDGTTDATQRIIVGGTGNTSSYKLNYNGSEVAFIQNYQNSEFQIGTTVSAWMGFNTNNTERMRIPAAGGVQAVTTISVGNATPSSSGAGITFPATQSASSDANTLDDYEEGNWTPTLTAGTAPSSVSYNGRLGRYTKIGRQVTVSCSIQVNSVTGGSGDFYISGLPFTVFSSDVHFNGGLFLGAVGWGASRTSVIVDTGQNETNIYVYALGSGLAPTGIPLSEIADTNDYMNFNLTYFSA